MNFPLARPIGRWLARYLSQPSQRGVRVATCSPSALSSALKKGDVLLVEGRSRFSIAIKYLTQSTWSHAALYIGNAVDSETQSQDSRVIVEADINEGIRLSPLRIYHTTHTRICRPVGLEEREIDTVINHAISRVGDQYDLKNVFDLARYLIQKPPVPNSWKRRLLAIGSGDPTRAICSSLIAESYHKVGYPILPIFSLEKGQSDNGDTIYKEHAHIRHHSLFAPGDFDLSPYFNVIKPTIEKGFDPHRMNWNSSES